jgi:hypothetical protein
VAAVVAVAEAVDVAVEASASLATRRPSIERSLFVSDMLRLNDCFFHTNAIHAWARLSCRLCLYCTSSTMDTVVCGQDALHTLYDTHYDDTTSGFRMELCGTMVRRI